MRFNYIFELCNSERITLIVLSWLILVHREPCPEDFIQREHYYDNEMLFVY